jgi:mRNA-degrading endonuclease toxin of MazEF toxin-antitoxin module
MERGDIYIVSLDPTSGHEQQGTRLLVSRRIESQTSSNPPRTVTTGACTIEILFK